MFIDHWTDMQTVDENQPYELTGDRFKRNHQHIPIAVAVRAPRNEEVCQCLVWIELIMIISAERDRYRNFLSVHRLRNDIVCAISVFSMRTTKMNVNLNFGEFTLTTSLQTEINWFDLNWRALRLKQIQRCNLKQCVT